MKCRECATNVHTTAVESHGECGYPRCWIPHLLHILLVTAHLNISRKLGCAALRS